MNVTNPGLKSEPFSNGAREPIQNINLAVSWGAIIAGATSAAALSLILLILGVGLGLSVVSPWASSGVNTTAFGVSTILWLTFVQIAASGMGGYLAGRLRNKWVLVHGDETYFRDTAHGFLAWGVATLITATILASAVGNILGGAAQAGASVASGVVSAASAAVASNSSISGGAGDKEKSDASGALDYWVDSLFRRASVVEPGTATVSSNSPARDSGLSTTTEAARILAASIANGGLTTEDSSYLSQLVAQRTGLTQADAQARVNKTFMSLQAKLQAAKETAQKAADAARKTSAYASLWLFVSLLIGAFVASFAATRGGRQRDM